MQVPREMRLTQHMQKAPTDDTHHTVKGLSLIDDMEQVDHLMEILVIMDHLVMTDILQDMDHLDVDHQGVDHQEEDLLVPLEILDLQDLKDHQEYLDLKEKEDIQDLQDLKDHQDHWEEQCSHPIYTEINPLLKWC